MRMLNFLEKKLTIRVLSAIFLVVAAIVTVQSLLSPGIVITLEGVPTQFTAYNNYLIFKFSFAHLRDYQDLYLYYLDEHWDLFKYTPTFSLLMAPFYFLPDSVGLFLWNALNSLLLLWGLWIFPFRRSTWRLAAIGIVFIELVTSLQNSQANGLMAGLIVLAFSLMERRHYLWAAFLITVSVFVKPFGVFAYALFLFHPHLIKHAAYSLAFAVILLLLPLIVVSPEQLIFLYKSWLHLLAWDMDASIGLSVQGMLQTWFHLTPDKNHILAAGLILLVLPLALIRRYKDLDFRIRYLAYILVWIIIFNHKAESPTFVIAVSGVAVWYLCAPRAIWRSVLLVLVMLFTVLSPTDIFSHEIRKQYIIPYVLKAVPCILVFLAILGDLFFQKPKPETAAHA